jgi:hypothetical protein
LREKMDRFKFIENRNINGPVICVNKDLIEIKNRAEKFFSLPKLARKIFKIKKRKIDPRKNWEAISEAEKNLQMAGLSTSRSINCRCAHIILK